MDPLHEEPGRQFEDRFLLRELNKALAAFTFQQEDCDSRRSSLSRRDTENRRRGAFEKRLSSKNSSRFHEDSQPHTVLGPSAKRGKFNYTADEDSVLV
ncbi:hypothetical protein NPIL_566901 [Nephila pilipes]|uniref:Uncharacterized protein n=1 Tax=Nephila pilipes TaxID=299642 RepID=A0A8X6NA68_NEPPI|nr:hypothetical protein NPIL_566901 [Nephila pilipes]